MAPDLKLSTFRSTDEDVFIWGLGARTSVGGSAASTAAAVRAGVSGLCLHEHFVDQGGEAITLAADTDFDPHLPLADRMLALICSACDEALQGMPPMSPLCCLLALPEPRPGLSSDIAAGLAAATARHLRLPSEAVRAMPQGHAAGLMAIQTACSWLTGGELEAVMVVGVDSYHDRQTLRSLEIHKRLKCSRVRGGFLPGEAAGACLLGSARQAARYSTKPVARVLAAATAVEPQPLRGQGPCIGIGLSAVIAASTAPMSLPAEEITDTYCDLNGERFRNEEFAFAQLRTQEAFADANDYVAPADCWGDVGAASGPLFAVLAATAAQRGYSRGRRALLWSGSDGGHRSAVTLALD